MMKRIIPFLIILSFFISQASFAKSVKVTSLEPKNISCRGSNQSSCMNDLKKKIDKQKYKTYNVVLVPLESAYDAESAKTATNILKKELVRNKIKIVDRKISREIKDELVALAQGGQSKGVVFRYADFAIKGEVLGLVTEKFYKTAGKNCGPIPGMECPNRCEVVTNMTVRISIFDANPLDIISDFTIEGENKYTHNNTTEKSCNSKDVTQDIRKGIANVFSDNANRISDSFASDGYVTALRSSGKKHYIRTQLEKSAKYPKGSKARVIYTTTVQDPLLGKYQEVQTLATGKVADTEGDNFVWVELDKKSSPDKILISDVVKIRAKGGKCSGWNLKCKAGGIQGKVMNRFNF